ncbi:hypothetical protein [Pseudomonas sp. SID14000]|uniref:hypothetical protein n=1 Tax=Pseudomonas sp. SID14000 TaxID=1986221 RepID=UPI000B3BF770|nr:hypothetical protein [Pseudomonas sp. SID14000]
MPDSPRPLAVTLQVVSIVLFTFIGNLINRLGGFRVAIACLSVEALWLVLGLYLYRQASSSKHARDL